MLHFLLMIKQYINDIGWAVSSGAQGCLIGRFYGFSGGAQLGSIFFLDSLLSDIAKPAFEKLDKALAGYCPQHSLPLLHHTIRMVAISVLLHTVGLSPFLLTAHKALFVGATTLLAGASLNYLSDTPSRFIEAVTMGAISGALFGWSPLLAGAVFGVMGVAVQFEDKHFRLHDHGYRKMELDPISMKVYSAFIGVIGASLTYLAAGTVLSLAGIIALVNDAAHQSA